MAAKFNIVAELSLRGPKNLGPLVKNIQRQLQGVNIPVNIKVDAQAQRALNQINNALKGTKKAAQGIGGTAAIASSNLAQLGSSGQKSANQISKLNQQSQSAQKNIQAVGNQAAIAGNKMRLFGEQAGLAVKRFAAFSIPTGIMIGFTTAIRNGFKEAVDFERELIKIAQVSGRTVGSLRGLTKEITKLATTFGVSSQELLETSRVLAQTGMTARDTQTALAALAKASLAPTFKDMNDTVEASIAAMRQFGISAGQLESKLGAINAVAGSFAVEAADISFAIRRTGGAFKAAGGELEELIALFTSVRSTTRESAETIATGFRTIFTRIQRPQTIAYLRELGIELQNAAGQFVGPMEAVKRLNAALADVPTTDPRFSQIVEQIGGYRQVSKVIPLITKHNEAIRAYIVAQSGANSLSEDAQKAQGALAVQIQKTKEEFGAFMRNLTQDDSIKSFAQNALQLARAFIKVADSAKSMIPMLASIVAFRGAFAAMQFGRGFAGGLANFGGQGGMGGQLGRRMGGGPAAGGGGGGGGRGPGGNQALTRNTSALTALTGPVNNLNTSVRSLVPTIAPLTQAINNLTARIGAMGIGAVGGTRRSRVSAGKMKQQMLPGFATGGVVPGQGYGDTVPAMLSPGEFVIKRSSAKKIGYNRLAGINKYAAGGRVKLRDQVGMLSRGKDDRTYSHTMSAGSERSKTLQSLDQHIAHAIQRHVPNKAKHSAARQLVTGANGLQLSGTIDSDYLKASPSFTKKFEQPLESALEKGTRALERSMHRAGKKGKLKDRTDKLNLISGQVFEDYSFGLAGKESPSNQNFDIVPSDLEAFRGLTHSGSLPKYTDVKLNPNTAYSKNSVIGKGFREGASKLFNKANITRAVGTILPANLKRRARGGPAGSDTIPALLTPGEFVVNAKSARSVGYGNLHAMNRGGAIRGYAKGGKVQRFQGGGQASGGGQGALLLAMILPTIVANFQAAGDEASDMAKTFANFSSKMTSVMMAMMMMPRFGAGSGIGSMKGYFGGLMGRSAQGYSTTPAPTGPRGRYGTGQHTTIAPGYMKGRGHRSAVSGAAGQAGAAVGMAIGAAVSATFSVMADKSRAAAEAQLQAARSMQDAAGVAQARLRAEKQAGASSGSMWGGIIGTALAGLGVALAAPTAGVSLGLVAAGGAIGAAGGAGIGYAASGDEAAAIRDARQDVRKKLLGDSSDIIRDSIADVEAKRATFEAKALTIRGELQRQEQMLTQAHPGERDELRRQLRSQISDYYNLGNRLVNSAKSLEDFKNASGGLGQVLINQIAMIRNIPTEEVEKQFTQMIEAQENSRRAHINLIAATKRTIAAFNKFRRIAQDLSDTASSIRNFASAIESTTAILFGEVTQTQFQGSPQARRLENVDFSNINDIAGFNAAVHSATSPFGKEGERLREESRNMANAFAELPQILSDARSEALASGGDLGNILEGMLGDKFGPRLTEQILKAIARATETAGEGQSGILDKIEEDAEGFVNSMIGGPAKALSQSLSEIAKSTREHAEAIHSLNNAKLLAEMKFLKSGITLLKKRHLQERQLADIAGHSITLEDARARQLREEQMILTGSGNRIYAGDADTRRDAVTRDLIKKRQEIAAEEDRLRQLNNRGIGVDDPRYKAVLENLNRLKVEAAGLTEVFNMLHDAGSEEIDIIKEKINVERQASKQMQRSAVSYAFGTDEQRRGMDIGAAYAMSGMSIDQVPSKYRSNVQGIYKSLADVELRGFGAITAEERKIFDKYNVGKIGGRDTGDMKVGDARTGRARELYETYRYLRGQGFDEDTAAKIAYAGATTKEEKLINSLQGYLKSQNNSQQKFLEDLKATLLADIKRREAQVEKEKAARKEKRKLEEERTTKIKERGDLRSTAAGRENLEALDIFEETIRVFREDRGYATGDIPDSMVQRIALHAGETARLQAERDKLAGVDMGLTSGDAARTHHAGRWSGGTAEEKPDRILATYMLKKRLDEGKSVMTRAEEGKLRNAFDDARVANVEFLQTELKRHGLEPRAGGWRQQDVDSSELSQENLNVIIKDYAARLAKDIGAKYGISDVGMIQDYLETIMKSSAIKSDGSIDVKALNRFLIPEQQEALMQGLSYSVVDQTADERLDLQRAERAYEDQLDAMTRVVFGKQYADRDIGGYAGSAEGLTYDHLTDADKATIQASVEAANELPDTLPAAMVAAKQNLDELRDSVSGAEAQIKILDKSILELNRKIATQDLLSRPAGESYTAGDLSGAGSATSDDITKGGMWGGLMPFTAGKTYYNPDKQKYFIWNDDTKTPEYLKSGGLLNTFAKKGTDTIPAMLSKGEAVLTPEQMESMGINNKILKAAGVPTVYASGGVVLGGGPAGGAATTLEDTNKILEKILFELQGAGSVGSVGFAAGGSIFKPKGTDTVPAMLTPGEFVIKKSSVDKYGSGMLSAINQGYYNQGGAVGGVQYLANGGKKKRPTLEELGDWHGNPRLQEKLLYDDAKRNFGMAEIEEHMAKWRSHSPIAQEALTGVKIEWDHDLTGGSKGYFMPGQRKIGLNPNRASMSTLRHEIIHAIDAHMGERAVMDEIRRVGADNFFPELHSGRGFISNQSSAGQGAFGDIIDKQSRLEQQVAGVDPKYHAKWKEETLARYGMRSEANLLEVLDRAQEHATQSGWKYGWDIEDHKTARSRLNFDKHGNPIKNAKGFTFDDYKKDYKKVNKALFRPLDQLEIDWEFHPENIAAEKQKAKERAARNKETQKEHKRLRREAEKRNAEKLKRQRAKYNQPKPTTKPTVKPADPTVPVGPTVAPTAPADPVTTWPKDMAPTTKPTPTPTTKPTTTPTTKPTTKPTPKPPTKPRVKPKNPLISWWEDVKAGYTGASAKDHSIAEQGPTAQHPAGTIDPKTGKNIGGGFTGKYDTGQATHIKRGYSQGQSLRGFVDSAVEGAGDLAGRVTEGVKGLPSLGKTVAYGAYSSSKGFLKSWITGELGEDMLDRLFKFGDYAGPKGSWAQNLANNMATAGKKVGVATLDFSKYLGTKTMSGLGKAAKGTFDATLHTAHAGMPELFPKFINAMKTAGSTAADLVKPLTKVKPKVPKIKMPKVPGGAVARSAGRGIVRSALKSGRGFVKVLPVIGQIWDGAELAFIGKRHGDAIALIEKELNAKLKDGSLSPDAADDWVAKRTAPFVHGSSYRAIQNLEGIGTMGLSYATEIPAALGIIDNERTTLGKKVVGVYGLTGDHKGAFDDYYGEGSYDKLSPSDRAIVDAGNWQDVEDVKASTHHEIAIRAGDALKTFVENDQDRRKLAILQGSLNLAKKEGVDTSGRRGQWSTYFSGVTGKQIHDSYSNAGDIMPIFYSAIPMDSPSAKSGFSMRVGDYIKNRDAILDRDKQGRSADLASEYQRKFSDGEGYSNYRYRASEYTGLLNRQKRKIDRFEELRKEKIAQSEQFSKERSEKYNDIARRFATGGFDPTQTQDFATGAIDSWTRYASDSQGIWDFMNNGGEYATSAGGRRLNNIPAWFKSHNPADKHGPLTDKDTGNTIYPSNTYPYGGEFPYNLTRGLNKGGGARFNSDAAFANLSQHIDPRSRRRGKIWYDEADTLKQYPKSSAEVLLRGLPLTNAPAIKTGPQGQLHVKSFTPWYGGMKLAKWLKEPAQQKRTAAMKSTEKSMEGERTGGRVPQPGEFDDVREGLVPEHIPGAEPTTRAPDPKIGIPEGVDAQLGKPDYYGGQTSYSLWQMFDDKYGNRIHAKPTGLRNDDDGNPWVNFQLREGGEHATMVKNISHSSQDLLKKLLSQAGNQNLLWSGYLARGGQVRGPSGYRSRLRFGTGNPAVLATMMGLTGGGMGFDGYPGVGALGRRRRKPTFKSKEEYLKYKNQLAANYMKGRNPLMSGPLGSSRTNLFNALQTMPGQAPMTAGAPGIVNMTGEGILSGTGLSPKDFERMTFGKNDQHYLSYFLGRQIDWKKYNIAKNRTGNFATMFRNPDSADSYMRFMDARREKTEADLRASYGRLQSVGLFKGTAIDQLPVQSNANMIRRLLEKGPKGNKDLIQLRLAYKRVENAPDPEDWERPPSPPRRLPATGGPMAPPAPCLRECSMQILAVQYPE
jgi:TP901 family phage tail tape measure protein